MWKHQFDRQNGEKVGMTDRTKPLNLGFQLFELLPALRGRIVSRLKRDREYFQVETCMRILSHRISLPYSPEAFCVQNSGSLISRY